jgi:ubiquinone/menaquinone biosynthesis C-methylase UbiE
VPSQGEVFDRLAEGECLYAYEPDVFDKLNALAPAKRRVLDVGCGDGSIGGHLTAESVVGVDLSRNCVALAARRGVRGVVADARRLPFPGQTFDTLYCVDALHHMSHDRSRALAEFDRVVAPGGTLLLVEPDARNPFVRLTQAPGSPIRVAPCPDEPAIDPREVTPLLERLGYAVDLQPIHLQGVQMERSVFPLWQRLAKAPFVIALAFLYRGRPNKFAITARKPGVGSR